MGRFYRRVMTMGMISLTALLAWTYCILEYRDEAPYVAGASVVLLFSVYILLLGLANLKDEKEKAIREYISDSVNEGISAIQAEGEKGNAVSDEDELIRLVKAMYVQVRKVNSTLAAMDDNANERAYELLDNHKQHTEELKASLSEIISKATKLSVKYNQKSDEEIVAAVSEVSSKLDEVGIAIQKLEAALTDIISMGETVRVPRTVDAENEIKSDAKDNSYNSIIDTGLSDEPEEEADEPDASLEMFGGIGLSQDQLDALIDGDRSQPKSSDRPVAEKAVAAEETAAASEDADVIPFPGNKPVAEDPNKMLSPDEIAALFASVNGDAAAAEEPVAEDPIPPEPVAEDSNKMLSPDEIAALFAAANGDTEAAEQEESEITAPEPVAEDPNKMLSPDEIAALFASMGS